MESCISSNNVVLEIAYDGTSYYGWQKTDTGPSIEDSLETVLHQILQEKVILEAASRTDRGVHARAQVVRFRTTKKIRPEKLLSSLNQLLPSDIAVQRVYGAPPEFHPTLSAIKKEYRYTILERKAPMPHMRAFSWHIPQKLDRERMKQALPYFVGTRDFVAFCNYRKNLRYESTVRTLYEFSMNEEDEGILCFHLVGDHFLYKMVRNLIGTVVYIGLGKIDLQDLEKIIASKSRPQAGITAPAHGLCLHKVFYEGL